MYSKVSLEELAEEVEAAAEAGDDSFSIEDWFRKIGLGWSIDELFDVDGSLAGFAVFFNVATLNTDVGYLYSREEDIELSLDAVSFLNGRIRALRRTRLF